MSFPDFSVDDAKTQWKRLCDLLWFHDGLGVWLDVSRMRVNAADFERLEPGFKTAFEAMQQLEAGAIANPDEQRQVGHYWLRAPELAPSETVGSHVATEIDQIEQFGKDVLSGPLRLPAANLSPMCSGSASVGAASVRC